jgi:hypothetical protein
LRGKATAGDDSDETVSSSGKATKSSGNKLEVLSIAEIKEVLMTDESLQEEDDVAELIVEIAYHLHP